jgi:DNA-binding Lrp family transcriptional regulator
MLTDLEKKVIASIQQTIPVVERPYAEIAQAVGVSEEEFLETLRRLSARGVIRRFGATLRHQRTGYSANAMAAWKVEDERADAVGRTLAGFPQVSHCYRRNPAPAWPYNLYTMIHAEDEAACRATAQRMALAAAVSEYALLFSREELKKTSMVYFASDDDT